MIEKELLDMIKYITDIQNRSIQILSDYIIQNEHDPCPNHIEEAHNRKKVTTDELIYHKGQVRAFGIILDILIHKAFFKGIKVPGYTVTKWGNGVKIVSDPIVS